MTRFPLPLLAALTISLALSSGCTAVHAYQNRTNPGGYTPTVQDFVVDFTAFGAGVGLQWDATRDPYNYKPVEDLAGISLTLGVLVTDIVASCLWMDK